MGLDYYIADAGNHRLVRMDRFDGRGWRTFGKQGSGKHQFQEPSDVTIDAQGRIYVADRRNRRIVRMDDFRGRNWVALGGPDNPLFEDPLRLAVDPVSGRLYVADFARDVVLRFDDISGRGKVVYDDGSEVLGKPSDLAFDRFGRLYITNDESCRLIRITDPNNDVRGKAWEVYDGVEIPGPFPGTRGMGAVSIGPDGSVYLVVMAGDQIVQLDEDLGNPRVYGTRGSGEGEFYNPRDLTFDREGRLIITDAGNSRLVRIDDMTGANWTEFGRLGKGKREFSWPWSCQWGNATPKVFEPDPPTPVAVPGRIHLYDRITKGARRPPTIGETLEDDSDDRAPARPVQPPSVPPGLPPGTWIAVADTYNHRLAFVGGKSGRAEFRTFGARGSGRGQFYEPRGLAVDARGRLLVVDTENARVVRIDDMSGKGWTEFRPTDEHRFSLPDAVAVHPKTGRIFVSDPNNNRVVRMDDLDGSGWTVYGDGGRRFRNPAGLDFDAQGRLYVVTTDIDYQVVRIDDLDDLTGQSWKFYDGADIRPLPRFRDAADVAVDPAGSVYASDPTNDRIVRLTLDLTHPEPMGVFGSGRGQFFTPLGVGVGPGGLVAVADAGNHRLVIMDPTREALWWTTGRDGAGDFEFKSPSYVRYWETR